jgi:Xaa-Pro aminopeptidase
LIGTKFEGICSGAGLSPGSPYGGSYSVIEKGAPLLLDYALTLDGYHSDYSRIVIWGEPSDEIKRAYDAMVEVEQRVLDSLVPGATCEDVYSISLKAAKQLGYEEEYMGYGSEKVRFVGHGVGLELDEPPFLAPKMKDIVAENMVLAIEPKVMLPRIGIVGIEDTVVVRSNGIEVLTDGERGITVVEGKL